MRSTVRVALSDLDAVQRAAEMLLSGELVGLPTETVYGLAARGDNPAAIDRIFAAKKRPRTNPLILHVSDRDDAIELFDQGMHRVARNRFDRLVELWPGPLTMIGPKHPSILDAVTAGGPTVAVRVPDHPLALAILRKLKELAGKVVPLAAPSANLSNYVSPTTAQHVRDELGDAVALVIDGGPCRVGLESTIVYLGDASQSPRILRSGFFDFQAIQDCLDEPLAGMATEDGSDSIVAAPVLPPPVVASPVVAPPVVAAPGQLAKHYSPRKPLVLLPSGDVSPIMPDTVRIVCKQTGQDEPNVWSLSPDGRLETAAANLYAMLRQADESHFTRLEIVACEEAGIGVALLDRLRRAANQS